MTGEVVRICLPVFPGGWPGSGLRGSLAVPDDARTFLGRAEEFLRLPVSFWSNPVA
jgi:hypothetical protein